MPSLGVVELRESHLTDTEQGKGTTVLKKLQDTDSYIRSKSEDRKREQDFDIFSQTVGGERLRNGEKAMGKDAGRLSKKKRKGKTKKVAGNITEGGNKVVDQGDKVGITAAEHNGQMAVVNTHSMEIQVDAPVENGNLQKNTGTMRETRVERSRHISIIREN